MPSRTRSFPGIGCVSRRPPRSFPRSLRQGWEHRLIRLRSPDFERNSPATTNPEPSTASTLPGSRFATARIPAPTLGKPHHPCPSVRTRLMPPGRGNKEDNNGPGPERVIPRGPRPNSRGLRRPPRGLDPGRRAKTFVQKKSIEPVEYSFSRRYTGDSLYLPSETL